MALAVLGDEPGRLAPGMVDVRGWEVRTLVDDVAAGSVHELLLDADGRVRWLDVALSAGAHVLVPAGQGRADPRRRRIWLPGLAADQFQLLPDYAHEVSGLDAEREVSLLDAYAAVLLREAPPGRTGDADGAEETGSVRTARPYGPRLDPRGLFPWEAG